MLIQSFLLVILLVFSVSCNEQETKKTNPKAIKGVLDLHAPRHLGTPEHRVEGWNFEKDGTINLDGDWEFYWGAFILPYGTVATVPNNSSIQHSTLKIPKYIPVPSNWNKSNYPTDGYATYRLKIINIPSGKEKALKIVNIYSNYKLFINNTLVSSIGKVGIDKPDSDLTVASEIIPIDSKDSNLEIVIHVSNFHYDVSGIVNPILFGNLEDFNKADKNKRSLAFFLSGSLLIMSLYHLGLFALRREDKSTLYFAVFCFLFSFRNLLTGDRYIIDIINYPYNYILLRIEFFALYISIPFILLFLKILYPDEFNKLFIYLLNYIFLFFSLLPLLFPVKIFSGSLQYVHILILISLLYSLYCIVKAILKKKEGSIVLLSGSIIVGIFAVNDILFTKGIVNTGHYISIGFFLFIFSQSYILSSRFSNAFKESVISKLYAEEQRMLAETRKAEIEKLNKAKDEFLSNLSHELKTPLTYIYMYSEMLNSPSDSEAVMEYNKEVFSNAKKLNDYVEDLILITDLESNIKTNIENVQMKTIIDEEISKLNNLMEGKSIHIDNVISDTTICQCDKKLITKAIHSIIKNSIIYNKDKGNIIISEKKDLAYTILSIHDTGIGIADDHKEKIFEKFFRVDSSLNYEIGGVGVGLYLAKKIVELHNGKVNVRSEFGKGTEFSILLPLKNKISND